MTADPPNRRTAWPSNLEARRAHGLAEVARIAPVLEASVLEAQERGYLTDAAVEALRNSGVLGIMTPDDLGGNEVDPVTAFLIVEALGRIDPSTAWTSTILLEGAGQLATQLHADMAEKLFGGRLPLKAGSLKPGNAERVDGGYRLSGQWDFVSGIHHADWVSAAFLVEVDGETQRRSALIPTSEVTILDAWQVLGMRATGSTAFTLDDCFVPDDLIFNPMSGARRTDTRLARLGMVPYVLQMHSGMVLGAARRALDEIRDMAPTKRRGSRINIGTSNALSEESWFQREFGELDARVRAARALAIETNQKVHERLVAGEPMDLELHDTMQTASSLAGRTANDAIVRCYRFAGAEAIREGHVLGRLLRDINTVLAHGVLGEVGFEMHGEFVLGLQTPETRRMI
ncbi:MULTISPECIES: acyl-CoA dehydrogenase family protein [unclassified Streptomyces]|uniref:acyl-CoA dehydrogenase family protein n=1 Tax=unclassified Streptomyces TaxID=2593676 RepID=UPI003D8B6E4D